MIGKSYFSLNSARFFNRRRVVAATALMFTGLATHAAQTILWDANAGTGGNDGSGSWYAPNVWWSVAGGTNYTWNGGGDQESVIFGAGVPGNYFITNSVNNLTQPISVMFANAGTYSIVPDNTGTNSCYLYLQAPAGNANTFSPSIQVGTNVTANIDVVWRQVNGSDIALGTNSVLTFGQGTIGNIGQITFKGSGPASSIINATNGTWGGVNNPSGTTTADGVTFNVIGTAIVNFGTRFDIARSANAAAGYPVANAVVNVGGSGANSQLNVNTSGGNNTGNHLQISRGGPAVLNVLSGGLVDTLVGFNGSAIAAGNLRITPDTSSQGAVNISGGTVNVGTGPNGAPGSASGNLTYITLFDATTPSATASATLNISGGIVTAKGIIIGNGGTWTANPTNSVTISGGSLYLDSANISRLNATGTNYAFNVSGGKIAATANWLPASTVPINLTNVNGNITFQAADINGSPFNLAFAGPMTGAGGLYKTGGGTLTLSGTNTYSGSTVVSNGTLAVSTLYSPVNGALTLDGSAGAPKVSVQVANVGQTWTVAGLTCASGSPVMDFNYGSFSPSTTVAPMQVNGNVAFTAAPSITIEGAAISVGTFPLISYSGTLSGVVPTTVTITLSGGSISGHLVNNTAQKVIALVVDSSSYVTAVTWAAGNGLWDLTTANWKQSGNPVDYADGNAVLFDDTASGVSPIAVTLNTTVNPGAMTFNNSAKNYSVSGTGSIAGSSALTKDGSGTLTLSGANTYTGGTVLNAGQLNLNYGGDGGADSAIGTGALTIKQGAAIDNTSGQGVALKTPIPQNWNDDFTFVGSGNLNLGLGAVTLGNATVALNVNSNLLEVDGQILDNSQNYGLVKAGNGTLVLSNANYFAGGLTLSSGILDLNVSGADGSGTFTFAGGAFDNTSGNPVSLGSSAITWKNSFTFNGSSSIDLGSAPISVSGSVVLTLAGTNTLYTEGALNGANTSLTLNGPGSFTIGGSGLNNGAFGLTLNGATANFNRDAGSYAVAANGLVTVNTNGVLFIQNPNGFEMSANAGIALAGGLVELNGDAGEVFQSVTLNSGVLQNSSGAASFALSAGFSLTGTNGIINLTNNSSLEIDAVVSNTGSFYLTGNGTLILTSNNVYTGSTVIQGGKLALRDPLAIGAGSISNTALIKVYSGATVDVTGRGDQTLTLNAGQTLSGKGTLNGNLVASAGSVVAPGGDLTTGTFTVSGNVGLNGTLLLNLNNTNTPNNSQIVSSGGTITYGGSLVVTNSGSALVMGQTFQLFPSAVTTFSSINLPATDASGNTYTWNNNVTQNGSITVAGVTPPSTINPNPGVVQISVSAGMLSLAWPTNAGWLLQVQTNTVATGLGTNWVTIPGSATVTSTNLTIQPGVGAAFYRLVHP